MNFGSSQFNSIAAENELLTDTINVLEYIDFNDTPAPNNPGVNKGRVYKLQGDDGLWYKPDAAGAAVDLTGPGAGGVVGPASAVDNEIALYNSTTGKLIKGSGGSTIHTYETGANVNYALFTTTNPFSVAVAGCNKNTFVGTYGGGTGLTTGERNTSLGHGALASLTTTATQNTGVGDLSLSAVSTGLGNTGIGRSTGGSITTGINNTCIGNLANVSTSAANNRIVIGYNSSGTDDNSCQIGNSSVTKLKVGGVYVMTRDAVFNTSMANGSNVFTSITTGIRNVFIGSAGGDGTILTTGSNNTAVGFSALGAPADGTSNCTAFGYNALDLATGNNNIAVGYLAGDAITTGTDNTCLGTSSDVSLATAVNRIALGNSATCTEDNSCQIGNSSVIKLKVGTYHAFNRNSDSISIGGINNPLLSVTGVGNNVFIGHECGGNGATLSTGNSNTAIGHGAFMTPGATSSQNVAIGISSLRVATGDLNACVGSNSGFNVSTGDNNALFGTGSGGVLTTGGQNVCIGSTATVSTAAAMNRIAIGYTAQATEDNSCQIGNSSVNKLKVGPTFGVVKSTYGIALGTGDNPLVNMAAGVGGNVFIGGKTTASAGGSGSLTSGIYNTAVGEAALNAPGAVTDNCTAIGAYSLCLTTGDHNTALGVNAGGIITTGTANTCVGSSADVDSVAAINRIAIGYNALCTVDNSCQIGDTNVAKLSLGDKILYNSVAAGATFGIGTLAAGVATINTTSALTGSAIVVTRRGAASNVAISVSAVVNATSFSVSDASGSSTDQFSWMIMS